MRKSVLEEIEKMIDDKINSNNIHLALYMKSRAYKDCTMMPPHPERGYELICNWIDLIIDEKVKK